MNAQHVKDLAELVEELDDDRGFTEFKPDRLVAHGKSAVLARFGNDEHWFPYSQLRHLDGDFFATEWIMRENGLL